MPKSSKLIKSLWLPLMSVALGPVSKTVAVMSSLNSIPLVRWSVGWQKLEYLLRSQPLTPLLHPLKFPEPHIMFEMFRDWKLHTASCTMYMKHCKHWWKYWILMRGNAKWISTHQDGTNQTLTESNSLKASLYYWISVNFRQKSHNRSNS